MAFHLEHPNRWTPGVEDHDSEIAGNLQINRFARTLSVLDGTGQLSSSPCAGRVRFLWSRPPDEFATC